MSRLLNAIDQISEKTSQVFSWFIYVTVFALLYEVVVRYVFNAPTLWSFDITYMSASLFIVMGGLAYNLKNGGHVSVDIVYNYFSPRVRAGLNIFFYLLLFFPTWPLFAKVMIPNVLRSWEVGETATTGTWLPVIYPFKTWVLIGLILFILQGVSEFLKNVQVLVRGEGGSSYDD